MQDNRVDLIYDIVKGNGQKLDELSERVAVIETKMGDRVPGPKKSATTSAIEVISKNKKVVIPVTLVGAVAAAVVTILQVFF